MAELKFFEGAINKERNNLCSLMKLKPEEVKVEVFCRVDCDKYFHKDKKVEFSLCDGNLEDNYEDIIFPPKTYNIWDGTQWPNWRLSVWHEFIHEIQDRIMKMEKPADFSQDNGAWLEGVNLLKIELDKLVSNCPDLITFSKGVCRQQ